MQVDLGEDEPRTIVSGLVQHVSLEQMQGARVGCIVNLKPIKMRGVASHGMVLCASCNNKQHVEMLVPPPDSAPGDEVTVAGHKRMPDAQLNPKKKVWDRVQPMLRVNADGVATYDGHVLATPKGSVRCQTQRMCGGDIS